RGRRDLSRRPRCALELCGYYVGCDLDERFRPGVLNAATANLAAPAAFFDAALLYELAKALKVGAHNALVDLKHGARLLNKALRVPVNGQVHASGLGVDG